MAKIQSNYRCTECGWTSVKWAGRCAECQQWGTVLDLADQAPSPRSVKPARIGETRLAQSIVDIRPNDVSHWPSGLGELDRVLGGGIVPGSVVLLGGSPGIGKSTLTAMALGNLVQAGRRVL